MKEHGESLVKLVDALAAIVLRCAEQSSASRGPMTRQGRIAGVTYVKLEALETTIGEISALLCRAALEAIESSTEQLTGASLEHCGYVASSERRRAAIAAY